MSEVTAKPDAWLTRTQVAKRLGISTSSVRRMEWDKLHPKLDEKGVNRYDPTEVDSICEPRERAPARPRDPDLRERARRGRLAARVFRMFAQHMTLQQIVVATEEPPDVIRDLFHEWETDLHSGEWKRRG